MTREEAIALCESEWWIGLPDREIVEFQLYEDRLCMDFSDYHRAVERVLGRAVLTHEFSTAGSKQLQREFEAVTP